MSSLLRRQIDAHLNPIREVCVDTPPQGWIRTIRTALGMTLSQLAKRSSIAAQTLQRIEVSEANETIQLNTLRRIAQALNCRLTYALVPTSSLQETVDAQMTKKATEIIGNISHSMGLEDQKTNDSETQIQIQSVLEDLKKRKNISLIWEED